MFIVLTPQKNMRNSEIRMLTNQVHRLTNKLRTQNNGTPLLLVDPAWTAEMKWCLVALLKWLKKADLFEEFGSDVSQMLQLFVKGDLISFCKKAKFVDREIWDVYEYDADDQNDDGDYIEDVLYSVSSEIEKAIKIAKKYLASRNAHD
jgi:hypothetical protein